MVQPTLGLKTHSGGCTVPRETRDRKAGMIEVQELTVSIVRGFLDIEMKGVPESIKEEIKRVLRAEKMEGGF